MNIFSSFRRIIISIALYRLTRLSGIFYLYLYKAIYQELKIGKRAKIWGKFYIQIMSGGKISIGNDFHLVSESRRSAITLYGRGQLTAFPGASIKLGNHVGLNGTAISAKKYIEIGDESMIATNVVIVDSDFHILWPPENRWNSSTKEYDKEVIIGRNVWIGMGSIILKGTSIGDNSIVGAGSVVKGIFPDNCLIAGNPAKVIRELDE